MPRSKPSISCTLLTLAAVNATAQSQHHQHHPPLSHISGCECQRQHPQRSLPKPFAVNAKAQSQHHQHQPPRSHFSGCQCPTSKPAFAASALPSNTSGCETKPKASIIRPLPTVAAVSAKAQSQHHQHQPSPSSTSGCEGKGPKPESSASAAPFQHQWL